MPAEKKPHTEDLLDEALKQTFPASDAIAIVVPHRRPKPEAAPDEGGNTGRVASRKRSKPKSHRR